MLPHFESAVGNGKSISFLDEDYDGLFDMDCTSPQVSRQPLRGCSLQAITKIVDYELAPGQQYEGVWHVEGMSHENIVSTGLYVLERPDDIDGAALLFKRAFLDAEAAKLLYEVPQERCPRFQKIIDDGLIPLGRVSTPRGRCIVFPNSHVHRVTVMKNTGTEPCRRRIVVFFLVNPDTRIISSQEVSPESQRSVMSREQAMQYRLDVIQERKYHKQDWNVREIELCEH